MSNTLMTLTEFHDNYLKLGEKDVIVDVRNHDEFREAHIKGAINYPVGEVLNHAGELKGYQRVFLHCKRGGRAKTAFETLKNAGLDNLVCVHDYGMDEWILKGYPVITGSY